MNTLPRSSSNFLINLFSLFVFFFIMIILKKVFPHVDTVLLTIVCILAALIPLWLYDLVHVRVYQRATTRLHKPGAFNRERLVIKLIGLYGTFLFILIIYLINPVYRNSPSSVEFYNAFFKFLNLSAPWLVILSFAYFWFVDQRQKDAYDTYWHAGCLFTGRFKEVKLVYLKEHARVWFIKGYFTPFMFGLLVLYIDELLTFQWKGDSISLFSVHTYCLNFLYAVDVFYGVLGYILTFRILDTHIRSTEPTFLGWLVCLICYSPFYALFGIGLLNYNDGIYWETWFANSSVLYHVIGIMILLLTLLYSAATIAIGYRMSNLTYRGIITSGPYRLTKHPAYLGKIGSWWLISLPFLTAGSPIIALKFSFNLFFITFIYYIRARTEENHLSNYPEYIAYANWIKEHGIFRFITKHFPRLQYSHEKCKKWGSIVWFKKIHQ